MMTGADGRRRVELASETITKHIVGITGVIAEEEDTNKRRREKMDDATTAEHLAADQPTSRTLPPAAPPGAARHHARWNDHQRKRSRGSQGGAP